MFSNKANFLHRQNACVTFNRQVKHLYTLIGVLIALLLSLSCDSDSGSAEEPVGPDLRGADWTGFFFRTDASARERITATINQDGNALFMTTSKADSPGQQFTGTLGSNGQATLTDAADGIIWTTFFGPASSRQFKISDSGAEGKQVIDLAR